MKWTSEYQHLEDARANVNKWSLRALVIAGVSMALAYYVAPFRIPVMPSLGERIGFALKWQIPPLGTLLFGILLVANKRFHSRALDPISGKDQEALSLPLKYLQNTVEQVVFSFANNLVLATYLEGHQLQLIPVMALLFVVGRLTFWIGYQHPELGHTNRHFGHVLTMAPCVGAFVYSAARLVIDTF